MLRLLKVLLGARGQEQGSRQQKAALRLELMEARDVPAILVWTAGGDGVHWSDANNWTEFQNGQLSNVHHTPTSTDDLYFGDFGGANTSSIDNINATASSLTQSNTYTGALTVQGNLTVSGSVTAYGAIDLTGTLSADNIYLTGGSISIDNAGATPLTITNLLDMTNGATFTVVSTGGITTISLTTLTMGTGTTFDVTGAVTITGDVVTSGTVELSQLTHLTTNGYSQATGNLFLSDLSVLEVDGSSPAFLSGNTVVTGNAMIDADTVQVGGAGVVEISNNASLLFSRDLDVQSGTVEFDTVNGSIQVKGNLTVFIGTIDMNVSVGALNQIAVGGDATIGEGTEGGGQPALNLTGTGTIPAGTNFNLIGIGGTGSGDFNTITAPNPVTAHGFNGGVYSVTL
jgi:hypothetical protein